METKKIYKNVDIIISMKPNFVYLSWNKEQRNKNLQFKDDTVDSV